MLIQPGSFGEKICADYDPLQTVDTINRLDGRSPGGKCARKRMPRRDRSAAYRTAVSFNTQHQAWWEAGAQRTLEGVSCMPMLRLSKNPKT